MKKKWDEDWFDQFNFATVEIAKIGKRTRCEMERGPSDNSPYLIWQGWHKDNTFVKPLKHDKNSALMLKNTFDEAMFQYRKPRYVGVVVEAYAKIAKNVDEIKNIQRGELQENFLKHYDLSIKEVISVICFDLEGHILVNITGYSYNDAGQPEFEATETTVADYDLDKNSNIDQGLTIGAIREFVALVKND